MKQISNKMIYILMILAALTWASAFIAGKYSIPYIQPATLTFGRFLVATLILSVIKKRTDKKNPENAYRIKKNNLPFFLYTGIVGILAYHYFFFSSLKYTTAISSSLIAASNPIMTAIFATVILREFFKKKQVIGIVLSLTGVLITITNGDLSQLLELNFNKGDLLMCMGSMCWASYSVVSRRFGKGIPPIAVTYYSFLICTIFLIPLVIMEKPWLIMSGIPVAAYVSIVYMAIFPSVFGYGVQQMAIKRIGPNRTSIFVNLVPIFSSMLAVLLLGEELSYIKVIAGMVIITGVLIAQTGVKQKKDKVNNEL